MRDYKQRDMTDCGAVCLAFTFYRHGLVLPISTLRQRAGTNQRGTTALGLVEAAKQCGFEAKGLRCTINELSALPLPGIAHVVLEGGRQHYVVVTKVTAKQVSVMDPRIGKVRKWKTDRFAAVWSNIFIVLSPSVEFPDNGAGVTPMSRLFKLLQPNGRFIAQALVSVLITTVLSLSSAVFVQKIVDNVIVDGNRNVLRLLGWGMLVVLALRTVFGYLQSVLMLRSAQRIDSALILGYYKHLMRLPQAFFDTMRVGEIASRVRDAVAIREFLNGTILNLLINPIVLIVALLLMVSYSAKLALYSLALVPIYVVIYVITDWINRRYQREIAEKVADFESHIVESLHAISIVRGAGLQDEMALRSEHRLVRVLKSSWSSSKANLVGGGAANWLTQMYSVVLLWIGADLVLDSGLTAGELMSCNALAGYITGPILAIIGLNGNIRSATTAVERLYEILDLEIEPDQGSDAPRLGSEFSLELRDVSFRYPGRSATLKNLDHSFKSGTITALVGRSGGGKSTLLSLMQRHYEPDSGAVLVNGVDVKHVKPRSLRELISYVPQRIEMLAGTILDNLVPKDPSPDIVRLTGLCKEVGILDFIEALPRGFQTIISENGANLSGGQKQRISIVRALYSDCPIVLMDEPSSALDSESEEMLLRALHALRQKGRVVILAVHNPRILSVCDCVVELEDGRIVSSKVECPLQARISSDADPSIGSLKENEVGEEANLLLAKLLAPRGGILVGQTDANIMGITEAGSGWFLETDRSDLERLTGRRPAVYGFDICGLENGWDASYSYLVPKILSAHEEGGIITLVWHPDNMVTGASHASGSPVADILPGAAGHDMLKRRLDTIAAALGNLRDRSGRQVPILFRIWHQQNGDGFWWGRSRCTAEEYKRLFRFTVSYLRSECKVRNFVFGFVVLADGSQFQSSLDRYPGDPVVDFIGIDWFGDDTAARSNDLISTVRDAVVFGRARAMPVAITALGFENSPEERGLGYCVNADWIKTAVVDPLKADATTRQVSWISFWRNEWYRPSVYNVPPLGSPHARAFQDLADDPSFGFDGIDEANESARAVHAA